MKQEEYMKKYYIYLRKSRADSELETVEEVLRRHEKILQEYALKNLGGTISEECIYREIVSGETIQNRPMMCRLLEQIQKENCTGVLVV
ncbi:MAG: recombinase family protein, partial [Oscillospiraceae bacterium]|nr:recombinase family protein [Oscillospiraceae bacterium]